MRNQFEGEEFLILEQGVNEVSNACGENFEEDKQFIASKMRELVELFQELYVRNNLKKVVLLKRLIRTDNVIGKASPWQHASTTGQEVQRQVRPDPCWCSTRWQ